MLALVAFLNIMKIIFAKSDSLALTKTKYSCVALYRHRNSTSASKLSHCRTCLCIVVQATLLSCLKIANALKVNLKDLL